MHQLDAPLTLGNSSGTIHNVRWWVASPTLVAVTPTLAYLRAYLHAYLRAELVVHAPCAVWGYCVLSCLKPQSCDCALVQCVSSRVLFYPPDSVHSLLLLRFLCVLSQMSW